MTRSKTLVFLFLLLCCITRTSREQGQGYTNVTGSKACYQGGSINASFVNQSGAPQLPLLNGSVFPQTAQGRFDSSGQVSFWVADNNQIFPSPSQWTFNACALPGAQPACGTTTITVTGPLQDISAALAPLPCGPSNAPVIPSQAYQVPYYVAPGTNVQGSSHIQVDPATRSLMTAAGFNSIVNPTPGLFAGADLAAQIATAATSPQCSTTSIFFCTQQVPSGSYVVTANNTMPSNTLLKFARGAQVCITPGVTWQFQGELVADRQIIFTCGPGARMGTVSFSSSGFQSTLYAEWFGAQTDGGAGTYDSTQGWQAATIAAQSMNGRGGTISCPQGAYSIFNTITSFAATTASGVSIMGPPSTVNDHAAGCSLRWWGIPGMPLYHKIGGHSDKIEGVVFDTNANAGAAAGTGLWLDSNNGTQSIAGFTASANVTSVIESGCGSTPTVNCVATITTATAANWISGVNVTFNNTGSILDGYTATLRYAVDNQHFVFGYFAQNGIIAPGGGTVGAVNSGDISNNFIKRVAVFINANPSIQIQTMTIASSVLSATLQSPAIIYPNQWIMIESSADPLYNAYFKVLTVTGPTTFTAQSTLIANEATATTGNFHASSVGMRFGTNAFGLGNNSVCCTYIDDSQVGGTGTYPNEPIADYEMDAFNTGNSYNFYFRGGQFGHSLNGWVSFTKGTFSSIGMVGSSVADCIFAGLNTGAAYIFGMEYENGTPYVICGLPSGAGGAAATRGWQAQFEANIDTTQITMMNNQFNTFGYGGFVSPDGVAVSTGGKLTNILVSFGYATATGGIPAGGSGSVTGMTYTAGASMIPGVYYITGTGTTCNVQPVAQVTVGSDGAVDVTAQNPTPVMLVQQGFGCPAPTLPVFTMPVGAGGSPAATFTPTLGHLSWINLGQTWMSYLSRGGLVSIGSTYSAAFPSLYIPVITTNNGFRVPYGYGAQIYSGATITSINDGTSIHGPNAGTLPWSNSGNVFPLLNTGGQNILTYQPVTPGANAPPSGAQSGLVRCPNNTPCVSYLNGARNTNNPDDHAPYFGSSDQLLYDQGTQTGIAIPKTEVGTCSMTATSCTFTTQNTYAATPHCVATPATTTSASVVSGACVVSGAAAGSTVTITAPSANSLTWNAIVFGNPN